MKFPVRGSASRWLSLALALLALACSNTETRTQLTFRIDASSALQARVATLNVTVRSDARGDQQRAFESSKLKWPVDIVVTPADGNGSTDDVTLFASAVDANGAELVSTTAAGKFMPEKLRIIAVALGVLDDGGTTPQADSAMPENDAGTEPGTGDDAGRPPEDDSGTGTANCATAGSTIVCDDENPCNGTETCKPDDTGADNNGCVKGSDVITCAMGSICDRATKMCSACGTNADGDKDGVSSVSCGGLDCDDNDETVAPGKPELCDGKDNDCDKIVDGVSADAACAMYAPIGGTATCASRLCMPHCTDPTYTPVAGVCTPPATQCPVNACTPGGTCVPGVGGAYTCTCTAGYRRGLDRMHCVAQGAFAVLGFETACDGTTDTFAATPAATSVPIAPAYFAACGLATIASNVPAAQLTLVRPATPLEGLTPKTALASVAPMAGPSALTFTFSTSVNTIELDVLGLEAASLGDVMTPASITAVATVGATTIALTGTPKATTTTAVHFAGAFPTGASSFTVTYTPRTAMTTSQFYVDQLAYAVTGCGDNLTQAGEACDDGNSNQCDVCDNSCTAVVANSPNCGP